MTAPTVCLLAAVELELAPLRTRFATSKLPFKPCFVATGPGKANGAMRASEAIVRFEPSLLVVCGCAGAFASSSLRVGDVAIAYGETFADEGVVCPTGFLDLESMDLPLHEVDDGCVYNEIPLHRIPEHTIERLRRRALDRFRVARGQFATVSTCSGTDARAAEIAARWHPIAESMEGAAIALAGLAHSRAVIEVRGISNHVGNRDRDSWRIEAACEHGAEAIEHILTDGEFLESLSSL